MTLARCVDHLFVDGAKIGHRALTAVGFWRIGQGQRTDTRVNAEIGNRGALLQNRLECAQILLRHWAMKLHSKMARVFFFNRIFHWKRTSSVLKRARRRTCSNGKDNAGVLDGLPPRTPAFDYSASASALAASTSSSETLM